MDGGRKPPAVVAEHLASEFLLVEQQGQWDATCASGSLIAVSTPLDNARLFVFERGFSLVYYGVASASLPRSRELYGGQTAHARSSYRIDFTFDDHTVGSTRLTHPHGARRHCYVPEQPAGAENLRHFTGVTFEELYPGIDLHCRLDNGGIKYEFHLHPGADPSRIALRIDGAGAPRQRDDGGLSYSHAAGTLRDDAPLVYQTTEDGVREVLPSAWRYGNGVLGFEVRNADPSRAVIIDPYLQWSTFLGGSLSDYARDVVIDKAGTMFVCGYSASPDFPVTPGAIQSNPGGSFDVFISAFSRDRRLLWSTYFGGSGSEENPRIALAPDGSLYVAGSTSSTDLSVTQDATQPRNAGRYDVFLLALDKQGRRRWATYFGGSYSDECGAIAVAPDGALYVTGGTYSTNFPVTADALQTSNNGDYDIFLARFSPRGKREWATYIGGWSMDIAAALAIGKNGDIFLGGRTESTNFPGLSLDRQSIYGGGSFDGFVMRVDPDTPAIRWSTYHGGEQEESVERLALDSEGHIILGGYTASERFPLAGNPIQKGFGGLIDVFVSSMNADGVLRWSTFLGGVEVDKIGGLAVDGQDNIVISGFTGSRNFPMAGSPFHDRKGGGYDIFIAQFSAGGGYLWGTFYGGEAHDISYGLGMDAQGNVVVVGGTESSGFRTVGNTFQGDLSGLTDAFLLRVIFDEPVAFAGQDTTICRGGSARLGGEASGGTPPYSYEWYPPGTVSNARVARPIASPLTTTSYRLTVTDAEGAVTSDTVVVTVTTPPLAGAGPDRAVCPGSSVVLQARAEKGQGPYSFLWSPSEGLNNPEAPNPVAAPSHTTQYILTVTDALGCEGKDSVTIRVHPGIEADAGGTLIACALSPTTLDLTVQGGTPPFRYRWTPTDGLNNHAVQRPVLIPRNDAIYVVTVTDANGCSVSDTLYVTVHTPPVVDAGDGLSLCAGSADKLRGRVSGGKPPYTYEWIPREGLSSATILTPDVRPKRSTVYVLSVRDGNGCVVRDSVPVIVHPQPILQMDSEAMACAAQGVQIGAEATGGTAPYRYAWTPVAGLSGTSVAMPLASPARNTTYTVTVTDANGCTVGASVRVTVQPRPELRYKDRHQICAGTSVELAGSVRGGSPPFVFEWTPETGLSDAAIARPVASPTTMTTYTVRITDALGCTDEQHIDVEIIARPVVDAGEDVILCEGVPVSLSGSVSGGRAPYTVLWEPATGLSSTRELSPTVRTTTSRIYTLTITDANGCQASDEVTVTVAPSPRANAGDDIRICAGAGRQIGAPGSSGTPPYRYQWTPGFGLDDPTAMRPVASPNQTTEYTVTVTDARGCTATDAVSVFVYPKPEISLAREMTICRDQGRAIELKVTGGSGPYRYDWIPREGLSDGSIANPIVNPIQTTTYNVTVTDENGCRITATITVTVLPCNKADAGGDQELCAGDDARLGPTVADTSYGAQYSWTPTNGLTSPHSAITRARPMNTTTYILAVRNRYDCISTDTVTVTVHATPVVDAGKDMRLCSGAEETVRASVHDGQPPYRYQWEPSTGVDFPRAASTVVRPLRATTYRVTVTDARGCTAVDSLHIHVSDPLRIALNPSLTVCEAQPVTIGGDITGGTPPYTVFWSPASGLNDRIISNPLLTPSGDMLYSVTITDAEGCQHIDSVRVRMLPAPRIAITVDGVPDLCKGERVRLVATPGYMSYAWSTVENGRMAPDGVRVARDESPSGDPSVITVGESGEYQVTVTDRNRCAATSEAVSIRVFDVPEPRIAALGPLMFCEGDSVVLDAGKGYASYLWSNGATGRYLTVHTSGSYGVTVTGEHGCEGNATSVATYTRPVPVAKLHRQRDTLIADEAPRYQWLRDGRVLHSADARILVVERGGRYQVRTSNEAGCEVLSDPLELRFASATVSLPRLNVRVGDTIDISLRLSNPQGLNAAHNETVSVVLALKKKTLDVISGGTMLSEGVETQRIRIDGRHEGGTATLATLRAIVHDGRRGRVPLKLETVEWSEALVRVTTRDGWLQIAP